MHDNDKEGGESGVGRWGRKGSSAKTDQGQAPLVPLRGLAAERSADQLLNASSDWRYWGLRDAGSSVGNTFVCPKNIAILNALVP